MIVRDATRNLRLCIKEKELKIAPYRAKYGSWWLIFADYVDYSMDPEDRITFRSEVMPTIQHSFEKIVLIDPRDYLRAFEI